MHHGAGGAHVGHTVEQHFVFTGAAAVYGEAGGAADVEGTEIAPAASLEDAGRGPGDLERIAALRGQIGEELRIQRRIAVGGFGLQLRDGGVDGNGVGHGADLELDVEAGLVERLEDYVVPNDAAEAIFFKSDLIGCRL